MPRPSYATRPPTRKVRAGLVELHQGRICARKGALLSESANEAFSGFCSGFRHGLPGVPGQTSAPFDQEGANAERPREAPPNPRGRFPLVRMGRGHCLLLTLTSTAAARGGGGGEPAASVSEDPKGPFSTSVASNVEGESRIPEPRFASTSKGPNSSKLESLAIFSPRLTCSGTRHRGPSRIIISMTFVSYISHMPCTYHVFERLVFDTSILVCRKCFASNPMPT